MGLIDTISVSKFGGMLQLGALSPATASVENACYILSFLPTATLNLLAEQDSQANNRRFKDTLRLAANIAAVGGIIQGILTFCFADLLVSATGAVGALKVPAMEYAKVRALGLLPFHLTTVASAAFLATKDSATAFHLGVLQGLINLLGNSMLCPRFPTLAAAAATTFLAFSVMHGGLSSGRMMDKTSLFLCLRRKGQEKWAFRKTEPRETAPIHSLSASYSTLSSKSFCVYLLQPTLLPPWSNFRGGSQSANRCFEAYEPICGAHISIASIIFAR